ncbi:MAG: agmatine deiminase family protein [Flavobacteriales bacterium]|nr:agmatine deiminase family protein [Flavobacteriales bacterium]
MKYILSTLIAAFLFANQFAQAQFLPHGMTEAEKTMDYQPPQAVGFTTPPSSPVRTPAEWEEIDGLCVRWEGTWSRSVLRNIVKHAKEECTVYIVTENQSAVVSHLNQYGIDQNNIVFVDEPSNSIWFRDYGQWNVYTNDVDSLLWVDWIYNRPRPYDDVIPVALADLLNVPLYQTLEAPNDLVNTGGNFMLDGFGTAFASELILEENDATNDFGTSNHSEGSIDHIMNQFMGIDRYIKMPTLPYDGIHHIDMHMKLLDEETLLIGQYPSGTADGPQIESNLNYVLNNFNSVFGTQYKIIRIPMPPEGGQYPNQNGDYRTYTNSVFVNKTILVPVYEEQWDTTALRIYREALPGYKVVGIDCNEIITASGAIHCITKAVSSDNPLLISHQPLHDQLYSTDDYEVNALIQHAEGVSNATLFWTTDTAAGYASVSMSLTNPNEHTWTGFIPYQQAGEEVFYYIHGEATDGKQQVRPMPAPSGYWKFKVLSSPTEIVEQKLTVGIYPNPSVGLFNVNFNRIENATYAVFDAKGKWIMNGNSDTKSFFINLNDVPSGLYLLKLEWEGGAKTVRLQIL